MSTLWVRLRSISTSDLLPWNEKSLSARQNGYRDAENGSREPLVDPDMHDKDAINPDTLDGSAYTWTSYGHRAYSASVVNAPYLLGAVCVVLSFLLGYTLSNQRRHSPSTEAALWTKPDGLRVVGFVFYGRRRFVDILDCYLQRNLAIHGGLLDEVQFVTHTEDADDLKWLDTLVEANEGYVRVEGPGSGPFDNVWALAQEDDTIYVKIDDDIVYVHDDAIANMVQSLLAHPEALIVAANLINSPITDWFHWSTDTQWPYLPDTKTPYNASVSTWRASELPRWDTIEDEEPEFKFLPPFDNHRWLPLEKTIANLQRTPMVNATLDPYGPGWVRWALGAQQHYSFLENLEKDRLNAYWFSGNEFGLWNMWYHHYNINFIAIRGRDVKRALPMFEHGWFKFDETNLSIGVPKKLLRPLLVNTRAIVSHFSFRMQGELQKTDLLSRYRAYANEMVCKVDNQKHSFAH